MSSVETSTAIETAAARLRTARASAVPCAPVRELLGANGIDAAYATQQLLVDERIAGGARVVGAKIGLTAPVVQHQFGVYEPDFGILLDDMVFAHCQPIPLNSLLQPRAEGELAFVLDRDIDYPGASVADVLRSTDFVLPAIEIVDSRIAGWDLSIADTVADNASSGAVVLGTTPYSPCGLDLSALGMGLDYNGTQLSTGIGKACLGSPVVAVAWLARELVRRGRALRAGEIVMSGALGPMVPITGPGTFRLRIDGMAEVDAVLEEADA
ncbi:2-keto-4-pentenoate hydratase [Nocardia brasiliensis]|uniref:2-keto-4-pentenoate hydratase n=1 Tax=Nocardia brasiliensis TaxID=37326 RepID=A0A6G9XTQ0_NOCBR|nr:fumarylacetoacetate hydrolase family protein [Nocardia brasiliensis]QIS04277.1 2-keto-4-pentenoate hydratase [Nocardia brasiliensis]